MNTQDKQKGLRARNVLRLPVSIEGGAGAPEASSREPARVLGFPLRGTYRMDGDRPKATAGMTYKQKLIRIVDVVIDKLDDDQLDSLLIEVERITGDGRLSE